MAQALWELQGRTPTGRRTGRRPGQPLPRPGAGVLQPGRSVAGQPPGPFHVCGPQTCGFLF